MKHFILFLLLTATASAQFPMVAAWQGDDAWTPAKDDSGTVWALVTDLSATKTTGDTVGYLPNKQTGAYSYGGIYQLTDGLKPLYHDSTGVGKGVFLRFDGSDDFMTTQLATEYAQPYSVFIVFGVYKRGTAVAAADIIRDNQSAVGIVIAQGSANHNMYAGTTINLGQPLTNDTLYSVHAFVNGAASRIALSSGLFQVGNAGALTPKGARYGRLALNTRATYLMLYEVMETRSINQIPNYKAYIQTKYGKVIP